MIRIDVTSNKRSGFGNLGVAGLLHTVGIEYYFRKISPFETVCLTTIEASFSNVYPTN